MGKRAPTGPGGPRRRGPASRVGGPDAKEFRSLTGKGVRARSRATASSSARQHCCKSKASTPGRWRTPGSEQLRSEGQTVVLLGVDGSWPACSASPTRCASPHPRRSASCIEDGLRIVMLTGDSKTTAAAVAKKLGLDEVIAEVLPDQKADAVRRLQRTRPDRRDGRRRRQRRAGDGPAQVGIAMGTGTDVAMHTAGVTLVRGDLRGIAQRGG
ncbi:MAG: HAD family hydrolase [Gemmataceae bacterium]